MTPRAVRAAFYAPMWQLAELQQLGWASAGLALDTQAVVAARLRGLAGLGPFARGEPVLMVAEKLAAFALAAATAAQTAARLGTPAGVMLETIEPLRRRASFNAHRLGAAGRRP